MKNQEKNGKKEAEIYDALGDFAVVSVPQKHRKPFMNIAITSAAWIITLSTMFTGGALASGLPFNQVIWATIVGMGILALYGLFMGFAGARFGVSTTMLARQCFGRQGAKVFGMMLVIILGIGWYSWQLSFFGLTMNELFPNAWWAQPRIAAVWGSVLMIITASLGYKGLAFLSYLAVPLVILLSIIGLNEAITETGSWSALMNSTGTGEPIPFFTAVTIVVGNAAIGAIVFADISRFGRSTIKGGLATMTGYSIGGLFCIIVGAAMVAATKVEGVGSLANIPAAMAALGLGSWAFVILVLAQWTTNDNNLYTASLGSSNIIKISKKWHVLIMGTIGTIIAVMGISNLFVPFLLFLGNYLPPVAGVMIADYWICTRLLDKSDYKFGVGTKYPQWNILALAVVILSGIINSKITFGIGAVNAIILSLVLYTGLKQGIKAIFKSSVLSIGTYVEDETGF